MPSTRQFADVGVFGSELLPATSTIDSVSAITVGFVTEPDAVRPLLPYHFEPAQRCVVRVSHMRYLGIDYLAGRGYNVVSVGVPVQLAADPSVAGSYNIVIWEGLSHAVNLGRELQGYAKIYGEVPDAVESAEGGFDFECSEYGTPLVRGSVRELEPYSDEQLSRLQEASNEAYSLGWKYIPGPKLTSDPDCDYATKVSNPMFYERAWSAKGTLAFCDVAWEAAPVSKRILDRLRQLPVIKPTRGFVGQGSASAPRATVQRLAG
ncbi:MAG: acetoacetate decarboxylase family protein [Acidimicrobiia bacterium]